MNKNMSIRDRIAMHAAISEMVYSPKLNEAYMALANGRRASSRLRIIGTLCVLERVKSGVANEGMFQMSDFSFYFGTPCVAFIGDGIDV